MADSTSSHVSSSSSSPVMQNPSSIPTIHVKLNGKTSLYWKGVMKTLLAAYGLLDHVEGRAIAPSKTITRANGVTILNFDYLRWESMDNFALTCVMLEVTKEIGVTILAAKTSQRPRLHWQPRSSLKLLHKRISLISSGET
ncbi:hypothetical protein CDL15_Pgr010189 [Punica granatum]|uniref:Retrotransposon Copia-like N-terminal domain-containing protein n=1 Tax=Punica granatum TaxID=22663 RepID=A0A218XQA1_PUNGR|nr:hypothetical protein CDL15_Pgr010189 [Punica granatum]PKH47710.1 hypothetical protein CRG98_050461 [Punica granatum]